MSSALIGQKEAEVENLARRYGVERYIGTERMDDVQNIIDAWAVGTENSNALTRESSWLDAKSKIESVLTDISLTNNAKERLYLLGQTYNTGVNGNVSFDEVKNAFFDAWNTLMNQYQGMIENLPAHEIANLDRMKDKALASIPDYGSIEEKNKAGVHMADCLKEIENKMVELGQMMVQANAKAEVANRETTRGIILSQAQADFSSGILSRAQIDQINALIGWNQKPSSQLEGQMRTLNQFSANLNQLLGEMDRTLAAAKRVLDQTRDTNGLAGSGLGFVKTDRQEALGRINAMGSTGGDGIRTMTAKSVHKRYFPTVIGRGVPYSGNMVTRKPDTFPEAFAKEGPSGSPWVGNQFQTTNEPTVVPHDMHLRVTDPAMSHRIYSTHGNISSRQAGRGSNPKFFGAHMTNNKMAGLGNTRLGGFLTNPDGFTDEYPRMTFVGTLSFLGFMGYLVMKNKSKKDQLKILKKPIKAPKLNMSLDPKYSDLGPLD